MVAIGNSDAHLKNWSLYYPDRINASLTPLYDQVSTVVWTDQGLNQDWALKLAGVKDPYHTNVQAFRRLAEKTGADPGTVGAQVHKTLERLADTWSQSPAPDLLPHEHRSALKDFWSRVPLLRSTLGAM
jgi:serine/threonine-protein kinase HipA